eukprot:COSAG04_NODE_4967_length_1801_cov_1.077556_2_plen_45_part_01
MAGDVQKRLRVLVAWRLKHILEKNTELIAQQCREDSAQPGLSGFS